MAHAEASSCCASFFRALPALLANMATMKVKDGCLSYMELLIFLPSLSINCTSLPDLRL